jgi:hypothetical protein
MLNLIYPLLKGHLNANQELNGTQDKKHIDWDLGQYRQLGEESLRLTPAIYIAFGEVNWETLPNKVQHGVLPITITLVNETVYGDDRDITDTQYINHLYIYQELHKALQGKVFHLSDISGNENLFGTEDNVVLMNTIRRTASAPHSVLNTLVISSHSFESVIYDYSAVIINNRFKTV